MAVRACHSFINSASRRRQPSPIRALVPLMRQPGMISLGSGMPSPAMFPISDVQLTLKDGSKVALGPEATAEAMQYSPTAGLQSHARDPELGEWRELGAVGEQAALD